MEQKAAGLLLFLIFSRIECAKTAQGLILRGKQPPEERTAYERLWAGVAELLKCAKPNNK